MNLLLLLSALLTALTGVGSGARTPQMAQAVAQQARVASTVATVATAARRPLETWSTLAAAATAPLAAGWRLAPSSPLYAGRRRE